MTKTSATATTMPLLKVDDEQRMVWGWASVATKQGETVIDKQGDIVEVGELLEAAHEFMVSYRKSKEMHAGKAVGTVVESMVFTKALQGALGIDLGLEGWLIGVKVHDDDVWAEVKKGTYRAFSIGGTAERHEVTD